MLRVNRRNMLASTAAAAAVLQTSAGTRARASGRRKPGGAITTITLVNTSGNTLNEGSVTQIIGCPFAKGDIPKGMWPSFQLGGANVPCTILNSLATIWNDGSLKFVPVMLSVPVSVPGGGSVTVNVQATNYLPPKSPRSLKDFSNGIDPHVRVDGLDNLSGKWVMSLKQAIEHKTKVVAYGNGSAGAVWKVRANAQQKGLNHGQLVCDFYVASLANPDGSLKGLRILGKVKLPYYDSTAPKNWMSFSRFHLSGGPGKLIRDCFGSNFGPARAFTFEWESGSTFSADSGYNTNNYGDYGYCTRLTTTGFLPGGLSTGKSYFTGPPTANTIGFATCANDPVDTLVSATSAGSGTCTATPYPYLAYFGALFTAGPTGMWDFLQGAGSDSSDTTLRFQMDPSYWVSTGLIPSYDTTLTPTSNSPTSYWPNCSEPVTRFLETTGERDDLGIMPAWFVRHLLTQAAVDEQVVRTVSLVGGHGFSIGLESSATLTYPCVNNTTYGGMPTPNATFRWVANGNPNASSGFTDTTSSYVQLAGFSAQDTTHMPQFNYYPYLFTGEPWHLDMLLEHANNAVYQRWPVAGVANISQNYYALGGSNGGGQRILTVGSNPTRYGITIGCNEDSERGDAWASGLLAAAAAIAPDKDPDCGSYKKYFNDMNAATWAAATDILNALPPFAKKWGLWDVDYASDYYFVDHWQLAYLGAAVALASTATENKQALGVLNAHAKYFSNVVGVFGGWHAGAYMTAVKTGDQTGSPLAPKKTTFGFYGPNLNWDGGTLFTLTPFSNYAPANGDTIIFSDPTSGTNFVTPAGFSKYTPYYMVGLSGNQFGLSPSPGGTPVPLTDSYSGTACFFVVSTRPPATGSISTVGAPTSYNTEVSGMLSYAQAAGATIPPAVLADLVNRNQQAGLNFTSNPKWAMTTTFQQSRVR